MAEEQTKGIVGEPWSVEAEPAGAPSETVTCKKCKREFAADYQFCPYCGARRPKEPQR